MVPQIIRPFTSEIFTDLQRHVQEVRRLYDAPGAQYHDVNEVIENKFNRWYSHNPPVLVAIHHDPKFIQLACDTFKKLVKPSYAFLSMYGKDGICPPHRDRPQCQFTIDLQIESNGVWPIMLEDIIVEPLQPPIDKSYNLEDGQALCYSGTDQKHYRSKMDLPCTFMNLAFFHFVPVEWVGCLT